MVVGINGKTIAGYVTKSLQRNSTGKTIVLAFVVSLAAFTTILRHPGCVSKDVSREV